MNEHLVFVYHANSDLFSTVTDFAHKILSPSTYACQLCVLTFGNFSMKEAWKTFIEALPVVTLFLHKDEFERKYKQQPSLPAIFISQDGIINEFASSSEINNCKSLEALKELVTVKWKQYAQHHHSSIQ